MVAPQGQALYDDAAIMEELPSSIRHELLLHKYQRTIQMLPFLSGIREVCPECTCTPCGVWSVVTTTCHLPHSTEPPCPPAGYHRRPLRPDARLPRTDTTCVCVFVCVSEGFVLLLLLLLLQLLGVLQSFLHRVS